MRRRAALVGMAVLASVWLDGGALGAGPAPAPPTPSPQGFQRGPPLVGASGEVPEEVPLTEEQRAAVEQMTDIREIQPPVSYGWDPRWAVGAAAAGLLVLVAAALWWLRRRRRAPACAVGGISVRPPEVLAQEELAALRREAGLGDKEFYFRLCAAVRLYLDGCFGAATLERTTEELLPVLRRLPLENEARGHLVSLFRRADPIRYADGMADAERRRADLDAAEALMRGAHATGGEGSG